MTVTSGGTAGIGGAGAGRRRRDARDESGSGLGGGSSEGASVGGVPLAPTLLPVVHTFNLRGNGVALHLKELDVAVILGIYKSMVVPLKRRRERQQQGRKPQVRSSHLHSYFSLDEFSDEVVAEFGKIMKSCLNLILLPQA